MKAFQQIRTSRPFSYRNIYKGRFMRLCKVCGAPSGAEHYCSTLCRLSSKTEVDGDCWIWRGAVNDHGYPYVKVAGKAVRAHRLAYQDFAGDIPLGLELDHTCKIRRCINPAHLEPVTKLVNLRRGDSHKHGGGGRFQAAKTHCPRGHPYSKENTKVTKSGGRACRECHRACDRARLARLAQIAP